MTEPKVPVFIRLSDLAADVGLHPNIVEKCIYRGIIRVDAQISHGRKLQPLFLRKRLPELVQAIRHYRQHPEEVSV